jgi:triacylglycerol esterase/lipase EstA (alpha/beta hydrolase family)
MRLLLIAALLAISAPAHAREFAPVDRPGPALSVPPAKLQQALVCTGDLRGAPLQPVLLVPGTNVTPQEFAWNYQNSFRAQSRPFCTIELPLQGMADIQVSGEYLVYAIRTMYDKAHRRIDVMGHSQGGMVPRWALRFWPDTRAMVDDLVGLAPSNHGTLVSKTSCQTSCPESHRQQATGSLFNDALNSRAETFKGIDYTVVYTHFDEVVVPNLDSTGSASLHTGAGRIANIATQEVCPNSTADHLSIGTYDPVAYALAIDAFDHPGPADPKRVPLTACAQALHPGVDPATFAPGEAETLRQLVTAFGIAPQGTVEPPLKNYVFAR